jgi:hypothetical protein
MIVWGSQTPEAPGLISWLGLPFQHPTDAH